MPAGFAIPCCDVPSALQTTSWLVLYAVQGPVALLLPLISRVVIRWLSSVDQAGSSDSGMFGDKVIAPTSLRIPGVSRTGVTQPIEKPGPPAESVTVACARTQFAPAGKPVMMKLPSVSLQR